jgi:3-phenylpropionate/trans-cinnamate dioxygenase ferredoxin reductase subunit
MMAKLCKVTLNNESFSAKCGDLLLDSALLNGVDFPHDCRAGICGACRVRLVDGKVFGGQDDGGETIYACQARVVSDLEIALDPTPATSSQSAKIISLSRLAPDVIGLGLEPVKPFEYLPGQYYKVQFRGFPARCYSPTVPLEGGFEDHLFHFHVRKVSDGLVSSALGDTIRVGHRVRLTGPFGDAFLRPNHAGRIVLVASGTGFAPMWSVAVAAVLEHPEREMVFVVQARTLQSLYMHRALCRLARFPNVTIIPIVSEPQRLSQAVRVGRPTDYLPELWPDDVVYTAGSPAMTAEVARLARAAGAKCHTDPFSSAVNPREQATLIARVADWLVTNPRYADKKRLTESL